MHASMRFGLLISASAVTITACLNQGHFRLTGNEAWLILDFHVVELDPSRDEV